MKEALIYPLKKFRNSWLGLLIMSVAGIYMAFKGMPSFIIGIAIGVFLCYIVLLIYKLCK